VEPEPLPEALGTFRASAGRRGPFGEPLYFFEETSSTNDVAGRLAEAGASEGSVVVALAQTAGRGRLGREWFSPPGAGLYVSVVCRDARAAPLLTLAGGVAVAEGITTATGLPVRIKWPNDIVAVDGPPRQGRRKLAGILAEAATGSSGLQYVVLGFGINLRPAAYPPALASRATSIEAELGRVPDAGAVLGETLASLFSRVRALAAGDAASVLDAWRLLAPSARGARVEWDTPAGAAAGTTAGIDSSGALLVDVGGRIERVIAGELRWTS
jgi:BirA family biotin operon repressor/biotin-[acetyl-CoA-carboxylase] ligase